MQKWEYCVLGGVEHDYYYYPYLEFFTEDGSRIEKLTGTYERNRVAKKIAELGREGWEMVGMGSTKGRFDGGDSHSIYFKRPVST